MIDTIFKDAPVCFNAEFNYDGAFDSGFSAAAPMNFDHNRMKNRDLPDQHPITAVTNLEESLEVAYGEPFTNLELEALLK